MTDYQQEERIRQGWEARRGEDLQELPVQLPIFEGHPRVARAYSRSILLFALRVMVNGEEEFYAKANEKLREHCEFYDANRDVRDDRDSFYWHIGELCRLIHYFGRKGSRSPGRVSPEAEEAFYRMALSYCHDMSRIADTAWENLATWRIYESENHHIQRDSALWQLMWLLIGRGMGGAVMGDGYSLQTHFAAWTDFFKEWLRERPRRGMLVEVQSRCYGIETLKNIYPLYDFAEDPELARLAGNFITLFWALWAQEQINGNAGGGQSRIYPESSRTTDSDTLHWAWYYAGIGQMHRPDEMDYICLDGTWRMPQILVKMIHETEKRGVYETWMRSPGYAMPDDNYPFYHADPEWGRINRYSYCTPDYILGTQMYRQTSSDHWLLISSQNRMQGVTFGVPDAQILPMPVPGAMHNLHSRIPNITFAAFWSMQREGTLITQRNHDCTDCGRMRVWLSEAGGVDHAEEEGGWLFTRCEGGLCAIRVLRGAFALVPAGEAYAYDPEAPWDAPVCCEHPGHFLVCEDPFTPVILETGRLCDYGSEEAFRRAVLALQPKMQDGILHYHSLYGHDFVMNVEQDGEATIDGEEFVRKIPWSFYSPYVRQLWLGGEAVITFDGEELRLAF